MRAKSKGWAKLLGGLLIYGVSSFVISFKVVAFLSILEILISTDLFKPFFIYIIAHFEHGSEGNLFFSGVTSKFETNCLKRVGGCGNLFFLRGVGGAELKGMTLNFQGRAQTHEDTLTLLL